MAILIYSPEYEVDIGQHVFPTQKYRLIYEQLVGSSAYSKTDVIPAEPADLETLQRVHLKPYLDEFIALKKTLQTLRSELPLTNEIVRAYILAAGGTIRACREVLQNSHRIACHIGGGFHHAFADHAEGFCYINDVAVAIKAMQSERLITKALVIDLDVHQGNGTAAIFAENSDVFTFSIHQEDLYPIPKQKSNWDIGLPANTGDEQYLQILKESLVTLLKFAPDLVIYVAGADPYQGDVLGSLKLSIDGLRGRDELVLQSCLNAGIPVVTTTAGGYAARVEDTVRIHVQTCEVAATLTAA